VSFADSRAGSAASFSAGLSGSSDPSTSPG
jgi:hypothetical protein